MAQSSGENSRELTPIPQFEMPPEPQEGQEALTERAIEQKPINANTPTKRTPKFPTQQSTPVLPQTAQPVSPTVDAQSTSGASTSLPAQEVDLIEKEWVDRAKHIVAQTQDDPYKQKNEMSKMKADYIKKRFDKTIPVDDSAKS